MRVAIQGETASFHDVAAKIWFGDDIEIVSESTFPDVFKALKNNEANSALVAIENSLYGSIHQVYDLLESYRYPIVGEVHLPVHQQLIGLSKDSQINRIYSHSVALAQCEQYLDDNYPRAERFEYHDTAAAVEFIANQANPQYAAIASEQAAHKYNLPILAENIEDNPANFTRFLVVQPNGTIPTDADRTTLVLITDNTPGSLAKILTIIADNGVNLSKLQSRPITGKPWKYRFYLVLDTAGLQLDSIIKQVSPLTSDLVVLGQYRYNP